MYNFSIIIPHKNIPELLERCLASIPVRDDVQVIVVDDSSDERVVDFGRFPGLGRRNTEVVFHRSPIGGGGGAGAARNVGLGVARGKWIVFADADDFFHTEVFSQALDRHADADADIVFFRHDSVDSETGERVGINTSRLRALDVFLQKGDQTPLRYLTPAPWGKFIRRELVENKAIRFDEVRFSAAVNFSLATGFFARLIAVDDACVYCNTRRVGALTHEGRTDWDAMATRFDVDRLAAVFAHEHGLGEILDGNLFERWIQLRYIDRHRARRLLPQLRTVVSRWRIVRNIVFGV